MSARSATAAIRVEPHTSASVGVRGGKRRRDIFKGLHDCVLDRGYARTTLADIARAARMSPSHLLYYFPGKDAILEEYFAEVARRIIERIHGFRTESPERQILLLAELFFSGRKVPKSEIGFMLECFGVAVHDKYLNREKSELDRFCKNYLRELFEKMPGGPARARDASEVAYAMLVGLRTAEYFDERLSPDHVRRLFHSEVLNLANSPRGAQAKKPRRR
ncbi:MAG: TetR/AcrR family transcriptional regulator [Steroidobacteraceae bacterium]